MSSKTDDLRIASIKSLISPEVLMAELSLEEERATEIEKARQDCANILCGKDPRLLVVVGPCSIHNHEDAIEYAERLKSQIPKFEKTLLLVMRVYFEKPRTNIGWKGYINDPNLDGSFDINLGLRKARTLLRELTSMGIPTGTEFLETISPQYIADLIAWGAIGARTTESQVHRELASGLSMPVGFKNGTDGNTKIAVDAIRAAQHSHSFLSVTKQGVSAIVRTKGNEHCHVILRGSSSGTNYDNESITKMAEDLKAQGLSPHVMVDCSHGNSRKDPKNQPLVAEDLCKQISGGEKAITGVMIESHLVEGAQKLKEGVEPKPGQSITDACISWETTEGVLEKLSRAVEKRMQG